MIEIDEVAFGKAAQTDERFVCLDGTTARRADANAATDDRPLREAVARAIADELYDGFDNAFADKAEWIDGRGMKGGRFRDVNEPRQMDYLAAADAAIAVVRVALGENGDEVRG
jgi:hypothetical protein